MTSRAARSLLFAALLAACGSEPPPLQGIQTRVFVDRSNARVGDPIGVTIEITTPPGYAIEAPDAPELSHGFSTQALETLASRATAQGLRHRVLWTLRARDLGDHVLPELAIPLIEPDGSRLTVRAGGLPLPVRSVRGELPEREVYFDIREPPPLEASRVPLLVGGALLTVALLLGSLVVRHRRDLAANAGLDPLALARQTLAQLELAAAWPDPRGFATHAQRAIWSFVEGRWRVPSAAATPDELPEGVDPGLGEVLASLEHTRFAPRPERAHVQAASERARAFLLAFTGDVVDG